MMFWTYYNCALASTSAFLCTVNRTMMSKSTSFIVLAAVLLVISTLSYCSADNVYCVTPTLPADTSCSLCPHNSTHCATLSEYAKEAELYFTSNTTIVFLPGDHTLEMNITVANIDRLRMHGECSSSYAARIVCSGSVGFIFTGMLDLNTQSLIFTSCGRNKATLLLESTQNAELVNCSFHDNLGPALTVSDTNVTLAENSEFAQRGSCITALNSSLIFIGSTTFIGNHGSAVINVTNSSLGSSGSIHFINNSNMGDSAGAIWASRSSLDFVGTSNFFNNVGGAIHAFYNSDIQFQWN